MRISDWSSDVCSSDLLVVNRVGVGAGRDQFACQPVVAVADRGGELGVVGIGESLAVVQVVSFSGASGHRRQHKRSQQQRRDRPAVPGWSRDEGVGAGRSEEHTSELQSLMRLSYAVFCLKKKK